MEKKIKEKFMPKIDEKKMEEMEEMVNKVKYHSDFTSYKNISNKVKSKRITVGIPEKLLKKIEKRNRRVQIISNLDWSETIWGHAWGEISTHTWKPLFKKISHSQERVSKCFTWCQRWSEHKSLIWA